MGNTVATKRRGWKSTQAGESLHTAPGVHARPTEGIPQWSVYPEGTVLSFPASSFETPLCSHSTSFICLGRLLLHHQNPNQLSPRPRQWCCLSSGRLDHSCLSRTYEPWTENSKTSHTVTGQLRTRHRSRHAGAAARCRVSVQPSIW